MANNYLLSVTLAEFKALPRASQINYFELMVAVSDRALVKGVSIEMVDEVAISAWYYSNVAPLSGAEIDLVVSDDYLARKYLAVGTFVP